MADNLVHPELHDDQTDLQVALQVDSLCDAFESSWREGLQPVLNDYLQATDLPLETLFAELVLIDISYRHRLGERPTFNEYAERYPHLSDALDGLTMPVAPIEEPQDCRADLKLPRFGKFELLSQVGKGTFGTVWKARDVPLQRLVAVKQFRDEFSGTSRKMLHREALAAAQIDHPNIVRILEFGQLDGRDYAAFEFVPGGTLTDWTQAYAKQHGTDQVAPRVAAEFARQLAAGLQAIHSRDVIHRDFKPGNILLDEHGTLKITDFGLARHTELLDTISGDGVLMGTIPYMSPEQFVGKNISPRSDIYSLGAVLYELLTGQRPLQGTRAELQSKIETEPPIPPSQLATVPPSLENICLRALEKLPEDRYQSAAEMQADLEKFLRGEEVARSRPPMTTKIWRRLRQRIGTIIGGSVVVASFAAALLAQYSSSGPIDDGKWEVQITTDPPGAIISLTPLDRRTDKPIVDPAQNIRPAEVTPTSQRLFPGEYQVVATLGGQRFTEVIRLVPSIDETSPPFGQAYRFWKVVSPGVIRWDPIKIPDASVIDGMVLIPGATNVKLGNENSPDAAVHYADIKPFYVSTHEFNLADFEQIRPSTILADHRDDYRPQRPVFCRFDDAMQWAEDSGARLLTEEEFEYLAQIIEARDSGDIAALQKITLLAGFSTEELRSRVSQIKDVLTGQAEWVFGTPGAYCVAAGDAQAGIQQKDDRYKILKGGDPHHYLSESRFFEPALRATASERVVERYTTYGPGYGFRTARSANSATAHP